jgi:hypothetical protein
MSTHKVKKHGWDLRPDDHLSNLVKEGSRSQHYERQTPSSSPRRDRQGKELPPTETERNGDGRERA